MEKLKKYVLGNFERVFILIILVSIFTINYFFSQKIALLNFYYLPVILAGYYLGLRNAVLGAFLCVLFASVYAYLFTRGFYIEPEPLNLILYISAWGGFLILSGFVVGTQQEKLTKEIRQSRELNERLAVQQEELNKAHEDLKEYSGDLETRIQERTSELLQSKQAIERLKVKVEETLYSTMDSSVAKLIIEDRLRNEKRKISVLFSDLEGFTNFSEERSPEVVVRDVNQYIINLEPIILDYHGHIDKYLGDGIMCEFGAPLDFDNYRLMSVLCAMKMQEKLNKLEYPLPMRIGIASGSAILGLIGSKRQSYTTIGDVVNISSRLEKNCPAGAILIDEYTLEGVHRFIDVRQKKGLPSSDLVNNDAERKLEELHRSLSQVKAPKDKVIISYQIGRIYMALHEYPDAVKFFERALRIVPNHVKLKVAFAEATMKRDEREQLKLKGRKQRVAAYEVVGLKDVMTLGESFPPGFIEKYRHIGELISIPDDVVLPVEALDGCIGHSKKVALLSYAVAQHLVKSEQEKLDILYAGFLADIGKVIIPHHILCRAGTLNDTEMREVVKHPAESVSLMKNMGYDSQALIDIVRHSHERINGSGYPDGLSGDRIPLGAKILTVADAYSAMTSWRPYRDTWKREAAYDELKRGADSGWFDPDIVDILINIVYEPATPHPES